MSDEMIQQKIIEFLTNINDKLNGEIKDRYEYILDLTKKWKELDEKFQHNVRSIGSGFAYKDFESKKDKNYDFKKAYLEKKQEILNTRTSYWQMKAGNNSVLDLDQFIVKKIVRVKWLLDNMDKKKRKIGSASSNAKTSSFAFFFTTDSHEGDEGNNVQLNLNNLSNFKYFCR